MKSPEEGSRNAAQALEAHQLVGQALAVLDQHPPRHREIAVKPGGVRMGGRGWVGRAGWAEGGDTAGGRRAGTAPAPWRRVHDAGRGPAPAAAAAGAHQVWCSRPPYGSQLTMPYPLFTLLLMGLSLKQGLRGGVRGSGVRGSERARRGRAASSAAAAAARAPALHLKLSATRRIHSAPAPPPRGAAPVGVRPYHHEPVAGLVLGAHGKGHQRGRVAGEEVAAAWGHALPPLPLRQLHKAGLRGGRQGGMRGAARDPVGMHLPVLAWRRQAAGPSTRQPACIPRSLALSRRCRASSTAWNSVGEAFR